MTDHLTVTLTVFYTVLFSMIICNVLYWFITPNRLIKIELQSIFTDFRFWIPCLMYTILLGFRWDYAYDWWQYYNIFNYIQRGELYRPDIEKGYLIINYLLGKLGLNYYSIFLLEGFCFFTAVFLLLKHNRKGLLLGFCIVYMTMVFRCLNLSRQFFAMSVLWIGLYHLLKGRIKIYWILVLAAFSIHTSTILWCVPFFLMRYLKSFIGFKTALIVFCCFILFGDFIFNFFLNSADFITQYLIANKSYDTFAMQNEIFTVETRSSLALILLFRFIKGITYIVCMYYCLKKGYIKDHRDYIILVLGYIGICLDTVGVNHAIISRSILYVVVFIGLGYGIMFIHLLKEKGKTPMGILILMLITIVHYSVSMYNGIVSQVINNEFYIEYQKDAFTFF